MAHRHRPARALIGGRPARGVIDSEAITADEHPVIAYGVAGSSPAVQNEAQKAAQNAALSATDYVQTCANRSRIAFRGEQPASHYMVKSLNSGGIALLRSNPTRLNTASQAMTENGHPS